MDITLTPDLEALIQDEVESGRYANPAEVVREALNLFRQIPQQGEERDALRREIQLGIDDLEHGAYTDYDDQSLPKLARDVCTRGLQRLHSEKS